MWRRRHQLDDDTAAFAQRLTESDSPEPRRATVSNDGLVDPLSSRELDVFTPAP